MAADFTVPGGTRPKAPVNQVVALTPPLDTVLVTDAANFAENIYLKYDGLTPSPSTFTIAACATTNGSAVVTTATSLAAPKNPKVGDAVSGTGIAGGSTIISVQSNGFTLSANATATGSVTLTLTPGIYSTSGANLIVSRRSFSMQGQTLKMRVQTWILDGSISYPASGIDATDYAQYGTATFDDTRTVDVNTFLTNQRVAQP